MLYSAFPLLQKIFSGNDNEVSTEQTVHVDTIPPTVETTNVPDCREERYLRYYHNLF